MEKDFKKREWISPNRMKFESGYRTFDRQVDYIAPGNVVSNVQRSSVVRPFSDTNGGACEPGRCRQFDIDCMDQARRIPESITEWLRGHPEEKCWLYDIHMRGRRGEAGASVCWILTDYGHTRLIASHCGWRSRDKRRAVMEEASKYLLKQAA